VVLLTNVIHLRGSKPITNLQGDLATVAARALHLYSGATPTTSTKPR
jgi:hypothetical protein